MTTNTPYGSWKSPITSDFIVAGTIGLEQIALDGADVYWIETRPSEQGRYVVMCQPASGDAREVTPPDFSARTRAHEYGGGAFLVSGGVLYFSNFSDQRVYCLPAGQAAYPLTPLRKTGEWRYADYIFDRPHQRLICVREEHDGSGAVHNTIVALPLAQGAETLSGGKVLVSGNDFDGAPALSPDGKSLAWLTWNHPNMPWDGTQLWIGDVDSRGELSHLRCVAGGAGEESIFQPEWSPDGRLYFVSDRSGWWSLYRLTADDEAEALLQMPPGSELEMGRPQWVFRMATYAFLSARRIACAFVRHGVWHLGWIDVRLGRLHELKTPYADIRELRVDAQKEAVYLIGGSPIEPLALRRLDFGTSSSTDEAAHRVALLRQSANLHVDEGYLSSPQEVEFPTAGGKTAFGFFYRPKNKDYSAPAAEKPPLLVFSHGGPTGMASIGMNLNVQYWTSRGFAVLDVNYGGSAGYGRAYRQRLNGKWGVVDVDDCTNAALYLVQQGEVDGSRLAIRGGSAGGYTTLAALTFRDVFKAGASYYGVSDLEALAQDTHKFESRYLDNLVGAYPAAKDLYRARSPIHFTQNLSCPVIFFQGLDDKVVPPNQAEMMVEALRAKKLPVAFLTFEGEGHGFRRAENIKRALDAELYFYSRIFGFKLAEPLQPVEIENFGSA